MDHQSSVDEIFKLYYCKMHANFIKSHCQLESADELVLDILEKLIGNALFINGIYLNETYNYETFWNILDRET